MFDRNLRGRVQGALVHSRVVGVVGARQAGKSTLVRAVVAGVPGATYVSLDDRDVRTAAAADPHGFVAGRAGLLAVDEVQRVPDLLLAIKAEVDLDPRPGRFLITGSSQLSANRAVSETLAGRIVRFELGPLSQGELAGTRDGFVDRLFADPGSLRTLGRVEAGKRDYLERAIRGGLPEARALPAQAREDWFASYVQTVVEREVPSVSASPRTADLPRILRLAAGRHAGLLNVADLARDAGLPERSVHRYLEVLEAVFLLTRIPPWAANVGGREAKMPKLFLLDSGLAAHLRGLDIDVLATPELARGADGPVLEGFVCGELLRAQVWSQTRTSLLHYREHRGGEIDLVLQDRRGDVVCIEVKAARDVAPADLRALTRMRDRLGARFRAGVVLHCGSGTLPLGDRLWAAPIAALWA